jgi:hypothetical protein
MKTVHTFFATVGLSIAFSMEVARGQNLIQDGSFESPNEPTNGVYEGVTPTGWTGGVRLYRGTHLNFPAPQNGNQYEGIQNDSISQTFNVVNAGLYLLTWYDNSTEAAAYQNTVTIKSASATLLQMDDAANARPLWNEHTAEVALGPGVDTLQFTGDALGEAHLLDNVSLVQIPDAANSACLLLIALAGTAGFARKHAQLRG